MSALAGRDDAAANCPARAAATSNSKYLVFQHALPLQKKKIKKIVRFPDKYIRFNNQFFFTKKFHQSKQIINNTDRAEYIEARGLNVPCE
ncbi:hypothetical protein QW131_30310 [Roseibium salinum]|nr:hypothetical protein [Roseibium salinum]